MRDVLHLSTASAKSFINDTKDWRHTRSHCWLPGFPVHPDLSDIPRQLRSRQLDPAVKEGRDDNAEEKRCQQSANGFQR